jgi:outer membrane receptor protein involved in Fe transport
LKPTDPKHTANKQLYAIDVLKCSGKWFIGKQSKGCFGQLGKDREIPEFILGGGAFYSFENFELAVFANYVSPYESNRFLPSGSPPAPLGDFTELNAQTTRYFGKKKDRSVFFRVDNIGDKHYSTVNGYPDQGRRFMTGVSIKF